jgi:hypothetical protein
MWNETRSATVFYVIAFYDLVISESYPSRLFLFISVGSSQEWNLLRHLILVDKSVSIDECQHSFTFFLDFSPILFLFYFIFFNSFIHMCIYCLGHFSPPHTPIHLLLIICHSEVGICTFHMFIFLFKLWEFEEFLAWWLNFAKYYNWSYFM